MVRYSNRTWLCIGLVLREGAREKCRGGVDKKMPTRNFCATQKSEVSK